MRQYLNNHLGFVSSPKLLSAILQMWITHYLEFGFETLEAELKLGESVTRETVIERINGGDCGTTALAVRQVYNGIMAELVTPDERILPLELIDNYNHAFLKLEDVYYDTMNLPGQPDVMQMMEAYAPNAVVESLTTGEMFKRYIWKDQIGAEMIRRFCQRFYVEPLKEAVELLNEMPVHSSNAEWFNWVDAKMKTVEAFRPRPAKFVKDESIVDVTATDGKTLEQTIDELVNKMEESE